MIMSLTNGNDWGARRLVHLTFYSSSSCSHFVHIKIQQIHTCTQEERERQNLGRQKWRDAKCRFSELKQRGLSHEDNAIFPSNDLSCAVYSIWTGQHINVLSMLQLSLSSSALSPSLSLPLASLIWPRINEPTAVMMTWRVTSNFYSHSLDIEWPTQHLQLTAKPSGYFTFATRVSFVSLIKWLMFKRVNCCFFLSFFLSSLAGVLSLSRLLHTFHLLFLLLSPCLCPCVSLLNHS